MVGSQFTIHDGDLRNSCDIILGKHENSEERHKQIKVPFKVLEILVAKAVLNEKISNLENITTDEILYK